MTEPTPPSPEFFRARIISGNRITIDNFVVNVFELEEGDLCLWRLVRVISRKNDVKGTTEAQDD